MAINLGTAYINISASTRGLKGDLAKGFGDASRSARGAGESAGEHYGRGFAQKSEGFLGKVMGGVGLGIGMKVVDGIGGALKSIGDVAIGGGISRALNLENATASLKGLGHDTESIEKIMKSALGAVKGTAFGMGDAAQVAASAVAAGIKPGEDLQRTLTLVGDAATIAKTDMGSMGGIFNKVATSNKLQMDSVNQLHDAGIPVLQLVAKEMGVTAEEASKMASKGEVSFDTFQSAMEKGLGGAAQESGKTFEGAMANTKAALGRIAADFATPVLGGMTVLFTGLIPVIDTLGEAVKPMAEAFGGWISDQAPKVSAWLETVPDKLKATGDYLKPIGDGFSTISGVVKGAASILFDGEFLGRGVMGMSEDSPVVDALFTIREGFVSLGDWINDTGKPAFDNLWSVFKDNLQPVLETYSRYINEVSIPMFKNIADVVLSVAGPAFETISRILTDTVLPILGGIAEFIGDKVIPVVKRFAEDVLLPAFRDVAGFIREKFLPAFETVMKFIRDEVAPVVSDFAERVMIPVFERIGEVVGFVFNEIIMPVMNDLWWVIENVVGPGIGWLWNEVVSPIFSKMGDSVDEFGGSWADMWDGLKAAAAVPVNFIIGTVWNDGLRKALNLIPGVDFPEAKEVSWGSSSSHGSSGGRGASRAFHDGGFTGPGGKYDPAGVVHAGEYVLTQSEVNAAGGARGIEDWKAHLPGYDTGGLVSYKGRSSFTPRFRDVLAAANSIASFGITKGGWKSDGGNSGTSHRGDAVDVATVSGAVVRALRSVGVAAWDRTGKGPWSPHVHGVPLPGYGTPKGSAVWQGQDYLRGGDGLGGRDNGPRVKAGTVAGGGTYADAGPDDVSIFNIPKLIADTIAKVQEGLASPWGQMMKTGVLSIIDDLKKTIIEKPLEAVKNFLFGDSTVARVDDKKAGDRFAGYRDGTNMAGAGWHPVGENGTELVNFGRGGGQVISASRTADIGTARPIHIENLSLPGITTLDEMRRFMDSVDDFATVAHQLQPA